MNFSYEYEQLDNAVEMSRCKDLIRMLPQGYETILTGSGENISQGQRQLLAIARAFVMDHGTIAESGSHEELLARHGKYYELYMTQYAGFAT